MRLSVAEAGTVGKLMSKFYHKSVWKMLNLGWTYVEVRYGGVCVYAGWNMVSKDLFIYECEWYKQTLSLGMELRIFREYTGM